MSLHLKEQIMSFASCSQVLMRNSGSKKLAEDPRSLSDQQTRRILLCLRSKIRRQMKFDPQNLLTYAELREVLYPPPALRVVTA